MTPINPLGANEVLPGHPFGDCGSSRLMTGVSQSNHGNNGAPKSALTVRKIQGTSQRIIACSRTPMMLSQLVRWPIG